MEMHQLRYAVAVAQTRNFSRAAEACHVSQPSLSQQILKLEDELGERIFDRTKTGIRLTPAGEVFLPRARRILQEAQEALREAADSRDLLRGTVTVGVLPTIAPYLLPRVIAEFSRKFPGIELVVQEDTTGNLTKQVLAYELDFALASLPLDDQRLQIRELATEELLLAVAPGHRLAKKSVVKISDLDEERFIIMKEDHCLGDQVLQFCARRDLQPDINFRSAQLETIQALVRTGLGVSLIPEMAVATRRKDAPEYRRFVAPRPSRKITAFWPKQRTPSRGAMEFVEMAAEALAR